MTASGQRPLLVTVVNPSLDLIPSTDAHEGQDEEETTDAEEEVSPLLVVGVASAEHFTSGGRRYLLVEDAHDGLLREMVYGGRRNSGIVAVEQIFSRRRDHAGGRCARIIGAE